MRETNHQVLHQTCVDQPDRMQGTTEYLLVRCLGCETIALVVTDAWLDPADHSLTWVKDQRIYGYRFRLRKPMKGYQDVPDRIRDLYLQCLSALGTEAPTLTGIGIRAVIEGVCNDQEARGRGLAEKIDDLVDKGALSRMQADFLHSSRLMGNRAAHEMERPSQDELGAALDIGENLLQTVYILPETTRRLTGGATDAIPAEAAEASQEHAPPAPGSQHDDPLRDEHDPFGDE